ncbi:tRNA (adenine(58)-N(1))-methyltransferase, mitochondrial isoform X2 [Parambassis ranga]|uniref:tRNA (adenine(58)-N(1))-methyltransferase n=1 Tax=Parambassis ranga TaxID=210632 RepID=A0A6P7HLK6_9TELE|nr:tRNA (adenine(58)-N(1))-methyltransferase, mitochondrial isoform X2 [Parambassis ranga]
MAVHMPFGRLFLRRLVTVYTTNEKHNGHKYIPVKLTKRRDTRTFSAACVKYNENGGDNSDSVSLKLTSSKQAFLSRRRQPLSPLERISRLLPQDTLSPEVMQLREQNQSDDHIHVPVTLSTHGEDGHQVATDEEDPESHSVLDAAEDLNTLSLQLEEKPVSHVLPGESMLAFGDLLIAEYRKKRVEFKKMFQLETEGCLQSSWGIIPHKVIAGQPAGQFLKTSRGVPLFIRRASLEDYVLYMKRGPTIAYPKDANIMLMMMDVTEGDCVLESGSGSGALSLFLSRAVGSKGTVLSVEVREDHYRRAMLNYKRWRTSWSVRRGEEWPDNVQFHNANLCTASSLLAGQGFNAVALDMVSPQLALPTVVPHLHSGAVCAVYLANITQVIDLLEGIRCSALPLLCERIIEVPIRDWVVAPSLQKNGQFSTRKAPIPDTDWRQDETSDENDRDLTTEENPDPAFGSIPYIARPSCEQTSHTAFLVKLRKCLL